MFREHKIVFIYREHSGKSLNSVDSYVKRDQENKFLLNINFFFFLYKCVISFWYFRPTGSSVNIPIVPMVGDDSKQGT